jgi:hypothetical protein
MSNRCPHYSIRYSEVWDADYCGNCGEWLEVCCTDTNCDCIYRPPNALEEIKDEESEESEGDDLDYIIS